MDQSSIAEAVKQICDEKGIPLESVIETIEAALAAAYRKDFGEKNQNIKVEFDLDSGKSRVFDIKEVVEDMPEEPEELEEEGSTEEKSKEKKSAAIKALEDEAVVKGKNKVAKKTKKEEDKDKKEAGEKKESEKEEAVEEEVRRFNPKTQVQLSEAKKIKKSYKIGDIIKTELTIPGDFGRMAAQTAKQVIIQKLRETERETLYQEFKKQEGGILVGTVQRKEGNLVLFDLGRLTALLPPDEQIRGENYIPGSHLKVYIVSVNETTKGPEVIVSRSHPEIVKKLFALEIPEIANGVVEIKAVAREAGSRSKIAVWTNQGNIDPIGSCIGQRGARIQTIISELKGEKVDIIKYSDDVAEYIANALSPAKILDIKINEKDKMAIAKVAEDQLSLAIGKAGQNVRLAAKLTGWKIDIISESDKKLELKKDKDEGESKAKTAEKETSEKKESKDEKKQIKEDKKSKGDGRASEEKSETKKKAKKKEEK